MECIIYFSIFGILISVHSENISVILRKKKKIAPGSFRTDKDNGGGWSQDLFYDDEKTLSNTHPWEEHCSRNINI